MFGNRDGFGIYLYIVIVITSALARERVFLHVDLAVFRNIRAADVTECPPCVNRLLIAVAFLIDNLYLFGFRRVINGSVFRVMPCFARVWVSGGRLCFGSLRIAF